MKFSTKKRIDNQRGVTMMELLLAITLLTILVTSSIIVLRPEEKKAKTRDSRRLTDIATLDRVINEYLLDYSDYPDLFDVLRDSTSLPGTSVSLDNSSAGWIDEDLSVYTSHLPIDPINDATYRYYYYHDDSGYELNAVFEYLTDEAINDGGDDVDVYEMGNNLTLISP
ncbi:prepilin-type N-terminal cleavage/methylation domain-containing protein [Patescibacteria group bacterium]